MRTAKLSALVLTGLLSATLAACGSNDPSTVVPGSSPAAAGGQSSGPQQLAMIAKITGKTTTVTLDKQFLNGLTTLKVTPGVVGETQLKDGALIFPITGGSVTLYAKGTRDPFVEGVIKHDGQGITLTAGGKTVELKNFDVDAGKSEIRTDITVDGKAFGKSVPTFIADGSTLQYPPTMENGASVLQGTEVKLTAGAAQALDKVFGVTAFTEGFPVGVAKIAVTGS